VRARPPQLSYALKIDGHATPVNQSICIQNNTHPSLICLQQKPTTTLNEPIESATTPVALLDDAWRPLYIRQHVEFPDPRLVQFDCGKLQGMVGVLAGPHV
jgi:hypothetical protein